MMNDLTIIPQHRTTDIIAAIDQANLKEGSRAIYKAAIYKMMQPAWIGGTPSSCAVMASD